MGASLAALGGLLLLTHGLHAQEPPPVVRLPPVQVKAAAPLPETLPRPWVPSSLDIVGPDDVRASRPRVLPDALERLPGVTLQNQQDRKSTRLNSSHVSISYAVFCLKKKKKTDKKY